MPMGSHRISEIVDMGITLSDGTRLSARVWMPGDAPKTPFPAILEYLPYRKRDGTTARDELTHPYFASHGYACLRVDIRGNGDSQGVMDDEYSPGELADAVQVINWIAQQDWCSGVVGMMGISWGGFNALQVAALHPEPLKAIITLCSTVDRFGDDIHYRGGCLLNANLNWGGTMLCYSSRPPDPALVGDNWRDMWLERLNGEPHLSEIWLTHQHRDAYWRHGSVCQDYSAITAATLAIGGWRDGYKNAPQALVENLHAPVKAIIGPWIHKYPHIAAPEPRIGFLQEALRWWDKWLKDRDTGVENDPDLRLFLINNGIADKPGRWISQDIRNTPEKRLYLGATGLGDKTEAFETRINCPATTGAAGEAFFTTDPNGATTADQALDDQLSCCFDSAILDQELAIVGAVKVELTLSSSAPVAQISVRLCELDEKGGSHLISAGVLNLAHRSGSQTPEPMPVGTPVILALKLDQTAYQMGAASRLRLSISNACWPLLWPAPGPTELTLTGGVISMPLLSETPGETVVFEPVESARPWAIQMIRKPSCQQERTIDPETGTVTLGRVEDSGLVEDIDHGLISGTVSREYWEIHPDDPLSARARTHWSSHTRRGDWVARTETSSEMHSDADYFYLAARIEAYEGDQLIFEKEFSKSIRRDLV